MGLREEFQVELALVAGTDTYISSAGSDLNELSASGLGLRGKPAIVSISTGPNPETISGERPFQRYWAQNLTIPKAFLQAALQRQSGSRWT